MKNYDRFWSRKKFNDFWQKKLITTSDLSIFKLSNTNGMGWIWKLNEGLEGLKFSMRTDGDGLFVWHYCQGKPLTLSRTRGPSQHSENISSTWRLADRWGEVRGGAGYSLLVGSDPSYLSGWDFLEWDRSRSDTSARCFLCGSSDVTGDWRLHPPRSIILNDKCSLTQHSD